MAAIPTQQLGTSDDEWTENHKIHSVPRDIPQSEPSRRSSFRLLRSASVVTRPEDRLAVLDDEEGHADFFLTLLYQSLDDSKLFVAGSVGILVVWSAVCAYFSSWLRSRSLEDPGGRLERWLEDIENCKSAISILGTLFVFTLVFRFNTCYDRWWEARVFWGDIISKCLDLNMMNRRWIADQDLGDRMSRFIIAYAYACKALLRGTSLATKEEDGATLVKKGILAQQELDYMHNHPCWQPHFCLEMIRAILVEVHSVPGGKGLYLDENNKLHGQMFRCFDGHIKLMTDVIGDSITMKSLSSISLFIVGLCAACGLGHKDPKTLADAMTVVAIAQGFLALEAPELNLRLYGTKDQSLYTQAFSRYLGASILSIGIISLCIFTIGLEVKLALGWSLVVWTGTHAQALLNQIPAKMGLSPVGQSLWLIHCVLCIYACFTNANYSENLLTTAYALSAVLSTVAIVAPKAFAQLYGGREVSKLNDDQLIWTQGFGYENLATCVLALALLNGTEPHQALGFMSLPVIAHCTQLLFGRTELGKVGYALVSGWISFHGANFARQVLVEHCKTCSSCPFHN